MYRPAAKVGDSAQDIIVRLFANVGLCNPPEVIPPKFPEAAEMIGEGEPDSGVWIARQDGNLREVGIVDLVCR
jgi:hypothetical protein